MQASSKKRGNETSETEANDEYICENCNTKVSVNIMKCPNCGAEFE